MPRQNLDRLQKMCAERGKVAPKEWPEGLICVSSDMREWAKRQDNAEIKTKEKKTSRQKKSVKSSGSDEKNESESNE